MRRRWLLIGFAAAGLFAIAFVAGCTTTLQSALTAPSEVWLAERTDSSVAHVSAEPGGKYISSWVDDSGVVHLLRDRSFPDAPVIPVGCVGGYEGSVVWGTYAATETRTTVGDTTWRRYDRE